MNKKIINKAFSLIELSIVILIIGILIAGITSGSALISKFKLSTARTLSNSAPVLGISGLSLWLDATSERAFPTGQDSDGTKVSDWYDLNDQRTYEKTNVSQSTIGNQPTYTKSAINGLPALNFNNTSNQYLQNTNVLGSSLFSSDQTTIFILQKSTTTSTTTTTAICWNVNAPRLVIHSPHNGTIYFDFGASARINTAVTNNFHNNPKILSFSHSSDGFSDIKVDGTQILRSAASYILPVSQSATFYLGRSNTTTDYFLGYIGEIIIYNRALKNDERSAIESYLSRKWGVPLTS
ncbi:MAG: LamG-like jellyroll fold domain-containing protein [Rickettsiales bacterium]|nr:LamG-like jellyroll fold domain-containing protein [Rickettsiales bacterium]